MTQKFDVPKIHKWADNIENQLTEWAVETVEEHFGVDDTDTLTEEQINEVREYVDESDDTWYSWVTIGFRNIVNSWDNNNEHD
jgi:hypothetical protein